MCEKQVEYIFQIIAQHVDTLTCLSESEEWEKAFRRTFLEELFSLERTRSFLAVRRASYYSIRQPTQQTLCTVAVLFQKNSQLKQ